MAHRKCGWKRGDSANGLGGITEMLACHFLHRYYMDRGHPSRLPLRLAALGLDGARPRSEGATNKRKWQAMFLATAGLPLVGTDHPAQYDQMNFRS